MIRLVPQGRVPPEWEARLTLTREQALTYCRPLMQVLEEEAEEGCAADAAEVSLGPRYPATAEILERIARIARFIRLYDACPFPSLRGYAVHATTFPWFVSADIVAFMEDELGYKNDSAKFHAMMVDANFIGVDPFIELAALTMMMLHIEHKGDYLFAYFNKPKPTIQEISDAHSAHPWTTRLTPHEQTLMEESKIIYAPNRRCRS